MLLVKINNITPVLDYLLLVNFVNFLSYILVDIHRNKIISLGS